ncbi:MAG: hypothetical protein E6G90_12850 [Alphaproteobacteria bacterium]|nr:MAG: hypothetical protein E6G90_12850 [Alphaproteobacteria bacterium]
MGDSLENDSVRNAVNTANTTPVALAQTDQILASAYRQCRRMYHMRCRGKGLGDTRFGSLQREHADVISRSLC